MKDTALETPYNQFCKYALGVSKFASTTGVLSELNRYPISINAWTLSVKYWHRLELGANGILLDNAYIECKNSNHNFYQNIQYLLMRNGLGHILNLPHNYRTKQIGFLVKQNLTDQHTQEAHNLIMNNDKFSTLRLCLSNNCNNLFYHKTIRSPHVRKCIARLRLDHANFYVEDHKDKLCDLCGLHTNSIHILTECTKTVTERNIFLKKVNRSFPNFINMTSSHKSKIILNLEHYDDNVVEEMCSYIKLISSKHSIV